jgi:hypothetical protein
LWKIGVSAEFRQSYDFFPISKVPGSDQAEGSDLLNVLNAQEVFLEYAGDIRLGCHKNRRPQF